MITFHDYGQSCKLPITRGLAVIATMLLVAGAFACGSEPAQPAAAPVIPVGEQSQSIRETVPSDDKVSEVAAADAVSETVAVDILSLDPDARRSHELWYGGGVRTAKAFVTGGDEVLFLVNGHSITAGEFLDARMQQLVALEKMRDQLANEDDGSEDANKLRELYLPRLEIADRYSLDNWALARIIKDRAVIERAIEEGFDISDEEIAASVEEIRTGYEQSISNPSTFVGGDAELQGYISVVGETKFWEEIFPERHKRALIEMRWRFNLNSELGHAEAQRVVFEIKREAIRSAELVRRDVPGISSRSVSVEDMLATADELEAFYYSSSNER